VGPILGKEEEEVFDNIVASFIPLVVLRHEEQL
jgi:hypothetical protein